MKLGRLMPRQLLKKPTRSTTKALKKFAKQFDLVDFGSVHQRDDEHTVIRGMTASAMHVDKHFIVGTIENHDVSMVERTSTLHYPGKPDQEITWLIVTLPISLESSPRIIIDNTDHDELYYANFFTSMPNFHNANPMLVGHDPVFHSRFKTYAPSDRQPEVQDVITSEITAMLAHHFPEFDYEINGTEIYVYYTGHVHEHTIERMVRIGVWLADHFKSA